MNIIDLATKTMQTAIKSVVDAIKSVVDGTKTKVDAIDTNLTNTKSVVDATKTKVDTMDTNISTLLAGRVVKSVQKGYVSISVDSANSSATVNISSVNVSKSIVLINGGVTFHNPNAKAALPYLFNLTSTSLVIRNDSGSAYSASSNVSWQVIEFY